jgi:hypothetical protein
MGGKRKTRKGKEKGKGKRKKKRSKEKRNEGTEQRRRGTRRRQVALVLERRGWSFSSCQAFGVQLAVAVEATLCATVRRFRVVAKGLQ